jgi:protein-S-isoprenylcysteine O-methyltransferase Ste14
VFSGDVPQHLVERGPYRRVRNPFYVSYFLCYLAGLAGTASWPLAVPFVVLLAAFTGAARHEERKFLASPLAAEYRAYMRRAGRFLPRLPGR